MAAINSQNFNVTVTDNNVNVIANFTDFDKKHSGLKQLDYASAGHTGFEPAKGIDDNFVTDAEKVVIGNTSGTNTGDQTKITQKITLSATDISRKYKDLTNTPLDKEAVGVFPVGGIKQLYTTDFTLITDGTSIKRLNWDGLSLESLLTTNDIITVDYIF